MKNKNAAGTPADAHIRLNKNRHALVTSGTWVILFCLWSNVKSAAYVFLENSPQTAFGTPAPSRGETIVFLVLLAIILGIDIWIRLYVGLSARAEGKGEKRGWKYLVWGMLLAAVSLVSLIVMLLPSYAEEYEPFQLASFLLELSSFSVLVEMIVCSIRVKKAARLPKTETETEEAPCR